MEEKQLHPTVSRVLGDGTLIELIYDPARQTTSLAVARATGVVSLEAAYDLPNGERLVPYSPKNNLIATECVLLPSAIGQLHEQEALLVKVEAFIHRYVDLSSTFAKIAAHYVLLSWVYDAFNELPYLRLQGEFGTGKTRALLATGSLCYKPFFASGASTVSPIFHILEAFGGTLILDEADFRFSDATADLTKILNNGNVRGLPVLRTMANRHRELNPQAFRVFGPKLVAMRRHFSDRALESRFITEATRRTPLRPDIPIQVPEAMRVEARELRNDLLAWRFATRNSISPDPSRLVAGLSPRASQTVLSLLSLIEDQELRETVCSYVGAADDQLRSGEDHTIERLLVSSILAAFERGGTAGAAIGIVTNLFNEDGAQRLGAPMTPRSVGHLVRTRLGVSTVKSNGVFVVPRTELQHVRRVAMAWGLSCADALECSPNAQSAVSANEPAE